MTLLTPSWYAGPPDAPHMRDCATEGSVRWYECVHCDRVFRKGESTEGGANVCPWCGWLFGRVFEGCSCDEIQVCGYCHAVPCACP